MGLRNKLDAIFKPSVVAADDLECFIGKIIVRSEEVVHSEKSAHCVDESNADAFQTAFSPKLAGESE